MKTTMSTFRRQMQRHLQRHLQRQRVVGMAFSCIFSLLIYSQANANQESVNETKKVVADGRVKITVERGDLEVRGWSKKEVKVTGKLDERTKKFIFDVDGDDTIIAVRLPSGHQRGGRENGSDLIVYLPENSEVDIGSVSTDIELDNLKGGVDLGTVSGDVTASSLAGRITLASVSGEIDLRNAEGRIVAKSVSGNVDARKIKGEHRLSSVSGELLIRNAEGDFDLKTVSGDIELIDVIFSKLDGGSVSGDLDIEAEMLARGSVEFETVSGSIRIEFLKDADARFDLETASGSIINRITSDRPKKSKYIRDEILRFKAKNGSGDVTLSTRSGDIVVSQ
ncbi:MAG: DUF4097 and DUF4098 domain-containing protein YvlB [Candidatus Azotimanducaceae bacterium]|jgi:DUF4097 and DUF4098 domain-containing protein YvlB